MFIAKHVDRVFIISYDCEADILWCRSYTSTAYTVEYEKGTQRSLFCIFTKSLFVRMKRYDRIVSNVATFTRDIREIYSTLAYQ